MSKNCQIWALEIRGKLPRNYQKIVSEIVAPGEIVSKFVSKTVAPGKLSRKLSRKLSAGIGFCVAFSGNSLSKYLRLGMLYLEVPKWFPMVLNRILWMESLETPSARSLDKTVLRHIWAMLHWFPKERAWFIQHNFLDNSWSNFLVRVNLNTTEKIQLCAL